jgi:hypothetical protein
MDERVTSKPKFEDPSVIVSVSLLNDAFQRIYQGCPVDDCGKPILSHSIRVDASCAKVTFLCAKGHPFQWSSSEQVGRQMLIFNRLVPASAIMTGLKFAPMKRFLALLEIDSQDVDYMKSSTVDLLVRLADDLYQEEIKRVQAEMHAQKTFSLGIYWVIHDFFPPRSLSSYGRTTLPKPAKIWLRAVLHLHVSQ